MSAESMIFETLKYGAEYYDDDDNVRERHLDVPYVLFTRDGAEWNDDPDSEGFDGQPPPKTQIWHPRSISSVQRMFGFGYARASREMEAINALYPCHCLLCGYKKEDAQTQMDHYICRRRGGWIRGHELR